MDNRQFLSRALKGAPATILIALALSGGALTNIQLQDWTTYTDKPLTRALAMLERNGLVVYRGQQYGWSLSDGMKQLSMNGWQLESGEPATLGVLAAGYGTPDTPQLQVRNNSELPNQMNAPPPKLSTGVNNFYSTNNQNEVRNNSELPLLSSSKKEKPVRVGFEEERNQTAVRKNSDRAKPRQQIQAILRDNPPQIAWHTALSARGVGGYSKKMLEILEAPLPHDFVMGWCAEAERVDMPASHLIRKILDGDKLPTKRNIPAYLQDIICD
jgi:hypothetical protein